MDLANKNIRHYVDYVIFGVLTTAVNYVSYIGLAHALGINLIVANTAAWFLSVLFAYVTNKIFVFKSKGLALLPLIKELLAFFLSRAVSGVIDIAIMYAFVTLLGCNDLIVKILSNVFVIIFNYAISRILVFRDKKTPTGVQK